MYTLTLCSSQAKCINVPWTKCQSLLLLLSLCAHPWSNLTPPSLVQFLFRLWGSNHTSPLLRNFPFYPNDYGLHVSLTNSCTLMLSPVAVHTTYLVHMCPLGLIAASIWEVWNRNVPLEEKRNENTIAPLYNKSQDTKVRCKLRNQMGGGALSSKVSHKHLKSTQ